ncbi:GNAT family N-acetyltransferase [Priestia koreensis]|uniref:GNAT family N-acetyltransferase n=1 Tax=Priestia koreensis TaxID=284581 RepID=UPI003CFC7FFF
MGDQTSTHLFRIDGEDIYLQEFSIQDANRICKISNEPEIAEFLPDWKTTKSQRINWITNYEIPGNKAFLDVAANLSDKDHHILKLGIFIKQTDEFIGWCCTGIKDELPFPNREIMYAISSSYQKKGYATKASKALIHYLFTHTKTETLNAVALTNNSASHSVIKKCCFIYQGERMIENERYYHYTLKKGEWDKKHK